MADLAKVIKGLEETESALTQAVDRGGEMAVMEAFKCLNRVTDVIALLKEKNGNIGHWVVLENCSNAGVYCSECQTKIFDRYPMKKKYSYFCPHCGTRMDEQTVKF